MQKKYVWMLAAVLIICGLTTVSVSLSSCEKANAQEDNPAPKVESTELIRTSQSWDGVELLNKVITLAISFFFCVQLL